MIRRAPGPALVAGVALIAGLALAACGGGGGGGGGASAAASAFVHSVTSNDRAAWCAQLGAPLTGPASHPLGGPLLAQCKQQDLFAITGSCDIEASISGASVSAVQTTGRTARASLSSGGSLALQRIGGRWLVVDERPGTHRARLGSGACAAA